MPSPRSPSQRATPPPPRIAPRRSPGFRTRGRSPDRRRRMAPPVTAATKYVSSGRSGSPTRSRDRREFRHSPRSLVSLSSNLWLPPAGLGIFPAHLATTG
uniref:Uncharacterized protein n=2 Tax=Timema TaxID=61471 RepID=A0A7R9ARR9_TIMSH|nr:unnamed protein product [Timema shepardi]CAD7568290.1 unnamed protein product [Timema californicum]